HRSPFLVSPCVRGGVIAVAVAALFIFSIDRGQTGRVERLLLDGIGIGGLSIGSTGGIGIVRYACGFAFQKNSSAQRLLGLTFQRASYCHVDFSFVLRLKPIF